MAKQWRAEQDLTTFAEGDLRARDMRLVLTSERTDVRALHMVDDEHSGTKGRGGMRKQGRGFWLSRLRLAQLVLCP